MKTMTKSRRDYAEKYLLGGEDAQQILDTLRSFPLAVSGANEILIQDTSTGDAASALQRAYEFVEMHLIMIEDRCEKWASHSTTDEYEYRDWVLRNVGLNARKCLGDLSEPDPIWLRRSNDRAREFFAHRELAPLPSCY